MPRLVSSLAAATLAATSLAACAAMGDGVVPSTPVEVSVTYRERILLTPGHTLTVRVEDVSLADAGARVLAEVRSPLDGRSPPFAVTLEVPQAQLDSRHTYAARAEIHDPSGALRFTTDTRHAVLTQGAPNKADIVLVAVR